MNGNVTGVYGNERDSSLQESIHMPGWGVGKKCLVEGRHGKKKAPRQGCFNKNILKSYLWPVSLIHVVSRPINRIPITKPLIFNSLNSPPSNHIKQSYVLPLLGS